MNKQNLATIRVALFGQALVLEADREKAMPRWGWMALVAGTSETKATKGKKREEEIEYQ